jgi:uncharacterized protein (DUF2344 family)
MEQTQLPYGEIEEWIDTTESLYKKWKRSGKSKRLFINENRSELEAIILQLMQKPRVVN